MTDDPTSALLLVPLPPQPVGPPLPRRQRVLRPERSGFLDGDELAADKVEAFLAQALGTIASNPEGTAYALVPWICNVLLSNRSIKAYGRDYVDFVQHMKAQGVDPLHVTADHVKFYKRALLEAGMQRTTVARRLSVLHGTYKQLAAKGLVSWEIAQDIAAIQAPTGVEKNTTPALTQKHAIALLEAIPTDTLQGLHDFALVSVLFIRRSRPANPARSDRPGGNFQAHARCCDGGGLGEGCSLDKRGAENPAVDETQDRSDRSCGYDAPRDGC